MASTNTGRDIQTFVVGDVHGHRDKLTRLLHDSGLIGGDESWSGGHTSLWFIGDFVDRGPDGIGVIDLVMRLQEEATAEGGQVGAILGNHDVLLLMAHRFRDRLTAPQLRSSFLANWKLNGGQDADLARLSERHIEWLNQLPAMALVAGRLLIHADSLFYLRYGSSIAEVNVAIQRILAGDDAVAWDDLDASFATRFAFTESRSGTRENAERMLRHFGGRQIIHGHTPIPIVSFQEPTFVTEPLIYADGLCVNVDGGMFLGGPGFLYLIPG